jgi:sulfur carrier protein ThiS
MSMQKAENTSAVAGDTIAVAVVSFGNDPQPLTLKKGATVSEALAQAGIVRGTQEFFVSGEVASDHDVLEAGDVLSVVSPKQAGN